MAYPSPSQYTIMTVSDLIDSAFGDPETNIVHHKRIQAVLFLLARQIRVLERKVYVTTDAKDLERLDSTLSVTEVTLHSMQKKEKKNELIKSDRRKSTQVQKLDTSGQTIQKPGSSVKKLDKDKPQDLAEMLDKFELYRERELRLIHQRADSHEEQKPPTPIESLDAFEAKYEKLLVVERVTTGQAKIKASHEKSGSRKSDTSLSIVTQEKFQELSNEVHQLREIFERAYEKPEFPENMQLMQELRRGASLTDAMSALQLSARLEATEKTIEKLVAVMTELAIRSGINPENEKEMQLLLEGTSAEEKLTQLSDSKNQKTADDMDLSARVTRSTVSAKGSKSSRSKKSKMTVDENVNAIVEEEKDAVYFDEFDAALNDLYSTIMRDVNEKITRNTAEVENAYRITKKLDMKLDASQNLGDKMNELQALVNVYTGRINNLDKSLTSEMANYQEELTQMQHDLENGLENMADVIANSGGDATAVAELNNKFNDLQNTVENSLIRQTDLKNKQTDMSNEFEIIRADIEVLRETKADRDEVEDALRDKAGLNHLNGMVYLEQFDAIRGEHQKQIGVAYEKFNNQELVWQKMIDELNRDLYDKADIAQLMYLRDEISENLNNLNKKIKFIMEIVGEPTAAAVKKIIYRDTNCISCSSPAHLNEETNIPKLPALRPPAIGAENEGPKADGDHGRCYPGYPIPHPIDARAHACRRWCGGSHTMINKLSRSPPGMIITSPRKLNKELGTDGKMYAVEAAEERKPCSQCIIPSSVDVKKDSFHSQEPQINEDRFSDMTPADFIPLNTSNIITGSSMDAPLFDD